MKSHAIRTARVPARLSHRRAIRPALEHWLAEADPARHGLPAQAIVLVRRLQAPWTALADPEANRRYGALASALAGAARPARGERHGDVVWFADEAELLACLARAVLAGDLALHWWWKLVLRELAPAAARARWLESVQAAPRAAAQLPAAEARRWVATWTTIERHALVQRLARVFPVAEEAVLAEMARAEAGATEIPHLASAGALPGNASAPAVIPASEGVLRLLLALAREPMAASEARRVQAIWHGLPPAKASVPASPVARAEALGAAALASTGPVTAALARRGFHAGGEATGMPPSTSFPPIAAEATVDPVSEPAASPAQAAASGLEGPATTASEPLHAPEGTQAIPPPAALHTDFGGLLFLLNAALQLGLYGDFTQPLRPRTLDCSPWRFLLASGRLYAGRAFADDPLAAWLRVRAPERPAGVRTRHPGLWRALRERLALALGLDCAQELVPALLRLPARIEDGGERVDLHMELAALPLPVRLAGLDRDPGWIPAAGCDIRFHFH